MGHNAAAARQLAGRARRRVQLHAAPDGADRLRQATLVEASLAAAQFLRRAPRCSACSRRRIPAAVWMPLGQLRVVLQFTVIGDRIVAVDAIANPEDLSEIDLVVTDR